jgi:Tripartite tricarboxylate transporter TctB family
MQGTSRFRREDVVGGICVAGLGLLGIYATNQLDVGTMAEIGSGFFPWALAWIVLILSIALVMTSLRTTQAAWHPHFKARALLGIIGALLVFAVFMRGAAFGPLVVPALGVTGATPLAILTAGLADKQTQWGQLCIFAVCLTTFCTLLFRFALSLPLPVAPWLIGY